MVKTAFLPIPVHGEYRQLVGDFTRDGGLEDAKPDSQPEITKKVQSFIKMDRPKLNPVTLCLI